MTVRMTSIAFGGLAAFVVLAACEGDHDGTGALPGSDGGDNSPVDAGHEADAPAEGAPPPVVLVDASVPGIACAAEPCAVEIVAGAESACVRLDGGAVHCWGSNTGGALGRGPDTGGSANAPGAVHGLEDATQLSASASSPGDVYCARRASGSAVCWGSNDHGVLGRRVDDQVDVESSPLAAPVSGLDAVTAVFAGYYASCATLGGTEIACWGSNAGAQIPNRPQGPEPLHVTTSFALAGATSLAVADRGTVALTATGLVSWGLAGEPLGPRTGVLGREASTAASLPDAIALEHVSAVAASTSRACAIANGRVYCWGVGPTPGSDSVTPAYVGVGSAAVFAQTLAVGPRSACATMSDGTARCWGNNVRGQLGAGHADPARASVRVEKLAGVPVRMAVMESTTCALLVNGAVQCWGLNDKGQLGTGGADALPHLEPQNVVLTP